MAIGRAGLTKRQPLHSLPAIVQIDRTDERVNFDTRSLDLADTRFQEFFYLDVIAPLKKCYESMM